MSESINIQEIQEKCKVAYESADALFKHGLTISTKPKSELTFEQGDCSIDGITESKQSELFTEMLSEEWLNDEDKISFGSIAFSKIHYLHITEKKDITIQSSGSHFFIILAESDADISIQSSGSIRMHIIARKQASVNVTHTILDNGISHKYAKPESGKVSFTDMLITDSYIRSYVKNHLVGKETEGYIKSFYLTKGKGICDVYTENFHDASFTMSDIITRGVLLDKSKALSRGLVQIGEDAPNSEGYEQQDALLLSNAAEADAIPNLVIHNHDVKCSHGSTVGKVDEEQLFYLQSRGIPTELAEKVLVEGYFIPVIDSITDEKVKKNISKSITEALYGNNN